MNEPTVADLLDGQSAWISAWRLYVDRVSLRAYIKGDSTVLAVQHEGLRDGARPYEFRNAAHVTNVGNGWLHVTVHEPYSWESSDKLHLYRNLLPVTLTVPSHRAYVDAGLIFEDQHPQAAEQAVPIFGDVLPQYALELTVADLPVGKTGWAVAHHVYGPSNLLCDGYCLIANTSSLRTTGPFGTASVAVTRQIDGTLTARFTRDRPSGSEPREGAEYSRARV